VAITGFSWYRIERNLGGAEIERRGKRMSICQRKERGISSPKRSVSDEIIESLDLRVKEKKEMNCSLGEEAP
jgi:hypothetical protein